MKGETVNILERGKVLKKWQDRLAQYGKGTFNSWIAEDFNWSQRTAYNYIAVYQAFGANVPTLGHSVFSIEQSALYLLSAPKTPQAARDEAIQRAEAGGGNMLVVKHDFSKALYDALVEQFKAENRSNGWYWKLDELVDSFVAVYVIHKIYFSAQDIEGFNEVWEKTKKVAKYLVYADDMPKKSTGFLADILCRHPFINRAFSFPSEQTKIFGWLDGYSFDLAAVLLKNDEAYRNTIRDDLYNALITLDYHDRIWQSALDEVNQRFSKTPQSILHIGGIIFEKDAGLKKRCHREAMKSLIAITKNYDLPADYGDEKESVLNECLGIELAPVKDQSLRSQLEWLEKKGNWVIKNIIQRLQQEFRKQNALERTSDLTANKEYLDAEIEDGRSYHEIMTEETSLEQRLSMFLERLPKVTETEQKEIQDVLSEDVKYKREETGKRRFEVMKLWTETPEITDRKIAKKIGKNRTTAFRDRNNVEKNFQRIFKMVCD